MRTALRWRFDREGRGLRSPRPTRRPWRSIRPPETTASLAGPPTKGKQHHTRATAAQQALVVGLASACRRKNAAGGPEATPLRLGEVTVRSEGGDAAIDETALARQLRTRPAGSGLITTADAGDNLPVVRVAGRVATVLVVVCGLG